MKVPHMALVALVDGTRFVVLRNEGAPFEPRLVTLEAPALDTTNYAAGIGHQDSGGQLRGNAELDELAHAAAAADWLNARALAGAFADLVVVADPKTLGEMRRHYHGELRKRIVGELDKAMAHEPVDRVARLLAAA